MTHARTSREAAISRLPAVRDLVSLASRGLIIPKGAWFALSVLRSR